MRHKATYKDLAVLARNNKGVVLCIGGAIKDDGLKRSSRSKSSNCLNGALAVELLEQFER